LNLEAVWAKAGSEVRVVRDLRNKMRRSTLFFPKYVAVTNALPAITITSAKQDRKAVVDIDRF